MTSSRFQIIWPTENYNNNETHWMMQISAGYLISEAIF